MRQDLVQRNIATLVHPPRILEYEAHNLTPDEANRLLAVVRGDRLEALYLVSLILGLRQGEALGLRWEDVNLAAGTMTIRRQLQVINGQPTFTEPKTQRSRRTIPLPAPVIDMLTRHRTRQKEDRLAAGGRWQSQWGLVFADELGAPASLSALRRNFRDARTRADLPHMRWHDLRHATSSFLAARGVHPIVAQAILGHASLATTLSVYTHARADANREATDLLGDLARVGTGTN
ncbi:MAG TPA: site-specific integrase [Thermomicrobiales bacterium]|nr:site-specific integrase [Thermomicrobiales bacterium]